MILTDPETPSLAAHYASLSLMETKIAEQETVCQELSARLAKEGKILANYKQERRFLHKAITAMKKRPAAPAALRRT